MRIIVYTMFLVFTLQCYAQKPSTAGEIESALSGRKTLAQNSILKEYPVRNIGPTGQGGRIVDIEVNLKDYKEFYVGYASGGIFKTYNNGITFQPFFDHQD